MLRSPVTRGRSVNTDTGLALIGRNRRGTQALKQNIAGRLVFVVDGTDNNTNVR